MQVYASTRNESHAVTHEAFNLFLFFPFFPLPKRLALSFGQTRASVNLSECRRNISRLLQFNTRSVSFHRIKMQFASRVRPAIDIIHRLQCVGLSWSLRKSLSSNVIWLANATTQFILITISASDDNNNEESIFNCFLMVDDCAMATVLLLVVYD